MIEDLIGCKTSLFSDSAHTELRAQENVQTRISHANGIITANSTAKTSGVNARVHKNGVYGFSSTAEYSSSAAEMVLKAANENANFLSRHTKSKGRIIPAGKIGTFTLNKVIEPTAQKDYIDYMMDLDSYIVKNCPLVKSRYVTLSADSMDKIIYTSDGYSGHHTSPRSYIYITLEAEHKDGTPIELFKPIGGFGNFEDTHKKPSDCYPIIDALYKKLMDKREGVYADAGYKTVVLGSDLAGMIAHEAVGHTVEADLVKTGSVAAFNLNKVVASELVNLTDFAHTVFDKSAPLPVYVDDEGVLAEDAVLIKNGVLTGYMNDRVSAAEFGVNPAGNARAWSFSDEPLIRMRNTAVLPGKDKLEDIIASVDDGYYLIDTNNGQADLTGEFMFGVCMGYEIKKGKLGRAIMDTTVTGIAFDMLKTVDMVSDNLNWTSSGFCGKKQWIPVSMGGPELRCKITIGGR